MNTSDVRLSLFLAFSLLILPFAAWSGDNVWTSKGPIGGNFPTFTFHPSNKSLIFAGTYEGLYRSTNSGASWKRLDISGGADTPVTVRIHPQNTGMIFASTESFLFRSTDQGDNWQQVSRLPVNFADFEFHPADSNVLYGVSLRKGVFRSNDGGRTWIAKNSGLRLNPAASCCDLPQVEVDPTNGSIVYVLLAGRVAYRSGNGGDSWSQLQGLRFTDEERALVIDPQNPATLYIGGGEGVFKSTNSGTSWNLLDCDCEAAGVAVDPGETRIVFAVGDGLKKSTNGGTSWVRLANSGPTANVRFAGVQVSPGSSNQIVVGGDGGGIFRSQNGGASLQPVNNYVDAIAARHLSSSPQQPGVIFAQGDFEVFRTRNAGATWELWPYKHDLPATDIAVHPRNAALVAVSGFFEDAGVAISSNSGTGWAFRGPQGANGANAVAMDPDNENIMFVAALSDAQNLGLARSTDRGSSWQFVNSGLTDKSILDIVVDPSNGANVYATTSTGKVFKSNNGGLTWQNSSSGLKGGVVYSLAVDRSNSSILYASTEHGVFKSTTAGKSWIAKNKGIPVDVEILFIRADPSDTRVLYCGGADSVFVTADGGENWSSFDTNGLGRFNATDLLINPAQPFALQLGANRGVFSYRKTAVAGGPEIVQLLPSSGRAGETIAVQGKGFGPAQGSSRLLFGSSDSGTAVSWSDERIQVRVPSNAQTGPVAVQVGSRKSNTLEFVVLPASGTIQPASGPSSGGTLVSIVSASRSGTLSFVLFGNVMAKDVRFLPPNTIVCRTPPGSGTVNVSLVGVLGAVSVGTYTYQ